MAKIRLLLSRHSLIAGLVLMFALTWPIDLAHADLLPIEVPFAVYLFLGWGFIIASLMMTGLTQGRAGVVALLKRFLIWRVGWRWYGIALGVYPALFLAALGLYAARTGAPIEFTETLAAQFFGLSAALPLFVVPFFLFEAVANGEELGWRGYVLPRVQAPHSALISALIVGIIWGLWHLPKYLYPFDVIAFTMVMVKATGDSILYTWLTNNTRGSLLLAVVFHATSNTAGFFLLPAPGVPGREPLMGLIVVLVVLVAIVVAVHYGPQKLSRTADVQITLTDAVDAS